MAEALGGLFSTGVDRRRDRAHDQIEFYANGLIIRHFHNAGNSMTLKRPYGFPCGRHCNRLTSSRTFGLADETMRVHRGGWSATCAPAGSSFVVPAITWIVAGGLSALMSALAAAQDCPTSQSGKLGFVVERGDRQKSEVFHGDGGIVRTIMRYNGTILLETTQHEGLFQLDRLDTGVRTKFEPQIDLKKLFPLKPGRDIEAKFISELNGQHGTLSVQMTVKGVDVLYIGPCKYNVLKIERSESRSADPPQFVDTDYYSSELKLILAKEYREKSGGTHMIKYDRIYPLKR